MSQPSPARRMPKRVIPAMLAALVVAAALAVAGCPQAAKKPQAFKPSGKEVKVDALYFKQEPGEDPTGGVSRFKVKVVSGKGGESRVGFFEEEVGGSGPQWRSAGWMAAIIGTMTLGLNPSDYKYTFDIGGYADGPSAGGAMTVAVLSSLLGDKVKKNVVMTGTINPDGTIGPVGGIPQKIEGADKADKKTVLIPAGQRYSVDAKSNEVVDVVEFGRKKGIKVKEVSDVYQAYKQFTGEPLPRVNVSDNEPELQAETYEKTKGKATDWYSKFTQLQSSYQSLPPAYRSAGLDAIMAQATTSAQRSQNYLNQGLVVPAYEQAYASAIYADVAYQSAKVVEAYVAGGGIRSAKNYAVKAKVSQLKTDAVLDRIKGEKPRSVSDVIAVVDAYGNFGTAVGLEILAEEQLNQTAANQSEALQAVAMATVYHALAADVLGGAEDSLDVGLGQGDEKKINKKTVRSLAEALRRGAEANVAFFDNVILAEQANNSGLSLELYKASFRQNNIDYAFATSALAVVPRLKKELGPGSQRDFATLGNSMMSFTNSAGLIAAYYSLGAKVDKSGDIVGVENEKALINMLDMAEKLAEENINLARKSKVTPSLAVYYYSAGKVGREGSVEEKFDALSDYWMASTEAKVACIISGQKMQRTR